MNLKEPYSAGIHLILPWQRMMKFDKTARYLDFDDLDLFTTDQASIVLDATVVYRIRFVFNESNVKKRMTMITFHQLLNKAEVES